VIVANQFRYLLCDLDDTLYPPNTGLMPAIGQLIGRYMAEYVSIPPEHTDQLRREYHRTYGTSLRGLMVNHNIDPESYLDYVHQISIEEFINPNPALAPMLESIPLPKVIFTNATREHAQRVMSILGIAHCFESVLDIRDSLYHSKPHAVAYQQALRILNAEPRQCLFVEDSVRNLQTARDMGMTGILVSSSSEGGNNGADIHITSILQLADVILPLLQ
jgi:putative hydrolase of the HAD superfamily